MFELTAAQLAAIMPRCPNPGDWAQYLSASMQKYGIAKDLDFVRAFLAQVAHESSELTRLEENLNYSADRLVVVFPKRFPFLEVAAPYARNPVKLANHIYANRMGNGDEGSGDGYRYRGRGPIMITGGSNYSRIARLTKDPAIFICPDRLKTARVAAEAACAWWAAIPKLNLLADDLPGDDDEADFISIRRLVNGGTVGLRETQKYWAKTKEILV